MRIRTALLVAALVGAVVAVVAVVRGRGTGTAPDGSGSGVPGQIGAASSNGEHARDAGVRPRP